MLESFALIEAVEKNDFELIKQYLENETISAQDTAELLYICVNENQANILPYFMNKIDINMRFTDGFTPLTKAAKSGHLETVIKLLELGAGVNVFTHDLLSALILAAHHGHLEVMKRLVTAEQQIDPLLRTLNHALTAAAEIGQLESIKYLLENGSDVSFRTSNRFSALMYAAKNGHLDIVELLIDAEKKIPSSLRTDTLALYLAAGNGCKEIIECLVKHGTDVNKAIDNFHESVDGRTSLMRASKEGHTDIVSYLLEHGADANICTKDFSALRLAAQAGHLAIVKLLIEAQQKSDPLLKIDPGSLMIAVVNNQIDVVKHLVHCGANIDTKVNGLTPLVHAGIHGRLEIVKFLTEAVKRNGTSLGTIDVTFILAAEHGHRDIVTYLFDYIVNINTTFQGGTALNKATEKGHQEIVTMLLEKGADIRVRNANGFSALMIAATTGRLDLVEILNKVEHILFQHLQASLALPDPFQLTAPFALIIAAQNGAKNIVEHLLNCNTNTDCNINGRTALMIAAEQGHLSTVELLYEAEKRVFPSLRTGHLALVVAARNGRKAIVEYLLKNKDININELIMDQTTLMHAVVTGHDDIVVTLLNHPKIEVNAENTEGMTALMQAVLNKRFSMLLPLLDAGANRDKINKQGKTALMLAEAMEHVNKELFVHVLQVVDKFKQRLQKFNMEEFPNPDLECPISLALMTRPITLSDGITYDWS